ncbi:MAG: BT_3928 family protein [bacterium]
MKAVRNLFRILLGVVFIFSGFVKGVDPLGTVYRMEDYFIAFGIQWAIPFALVLTIFLVVLEFTLGISLMFNFWIKKTSWLLLPMMTFFTVLTFFDAVYNMVPDCGCFGDALKLTNLQTFLKNIVLMAMVIPVFVWRNKYRSPLGCRWNIIVLSAFAALCTCLSVYCYYHLPLIDFMAWKVGNKVKTVESLPVKFYVTYKNRKTGELKEYLAPNYPWSDSTWLSEWVFKSQRVEDPNLNQTMALRVEDQNGNDMTSVILDNPGFQFIVVAYDLTKSSPDGFLKLLPFYKQSLTDGLGFICLTTTLPSDIKTFRLKQGTAFGFYNADDVVLKTMVRANPGVILIRNGVVVAKWSWRDLPPYGQVKEKFMQPMSK